MARDNGPGRTNELGGGRGRNGCLTGEPGFGKGFADWVQEHGLTDSSRFPELAT